MAEPSTALDSEPLSGSSLGAKFETVDSAIEALAASKDQDDNEDDDTVVRHLNLSCSDVDSDGVARLTEALAGHTALETINLAWNGITGASVPALAEVLAKMPNLKEIDLKYNDIQTEGAEAMATVLKESPSLTVLDLVKNSIPAAGAEALAEALKSTSSLRALHLGHNDIGDDGMIALATALEQNTTLAILEVDKNDVGPLGAEALAATLVDKNCTLSDVKMQENTIGDFGAEWFAKVLGANRALKRLDLRANEITDAGAEVLCAAAKESGLEEIDICQNDLSAEMHFRLDGEAQEQGPNIMHTSLSSEEQGEEFDMGGGDPLLDGEDFEEACSPPDDLQEANPTATVQRMLGIVEDQDDIAFDNATWYLNSQPELAPELWKMAFESEEEMPQVRCLEIFRHLVQQASASQVIIGLDEAGLPAPVLSTYQHLPQVAALLSTPPARMVQLTTTFGCVEERFGLLRSRALDLLVDLVETRNGTICDAIAESDALPVLFEKFFVYKWNSALHSSVLRMVEYIFDVEDAGRSMNKLRQKLLAPAPQGCGFLKRLMDAFDSTTPETVEVRALDTPPVENQEPIEYESAVLEQKLVAASKQVGYMSAVIEMAQCYENALSQQGSLALRELVDSLSDKDEQDRWEKFTTEVLERLDDVSPEKRCLGGEKPRPNPTCGQQ